MNESLKLKTDYSYFAAANSFDGFMSYFDNVFSSRSYSKIFVLKGGPGTGKSTLMRRLCAFAAQEGYYHEAIFCSSDPKSLDGVIIKNGDVKIAMLDGTAPHERDAIIPGATDELVNLGVAWNCEMLEAARGKIYDLSAKKNRAYSKAYDNLATSAIFDRKIKAEIAKVFDFKAAEERINHLTRELVTEGVGKRDIRLIGAFCKSGYVRLDTLDKISSRIYSVYGKAGSDGIFMNLLRANLQKTDTDFCMFPTPLDKNSVEAIYIENSRTAIITNGNAGELIDTTEFLDNEAIKELEADLITFSSIKDDFLQRAAKNLDTASKLHFELEDIYSPAMDFGVIEKMSEEIIAKCKKVLRAAT